MTDGVGGEGPSSGGPRWAANFRGRQPGAIDHAFAVLEEVARGGPGLTARQITERLGMPRATAYKVIRHLTEQEYLARTPDLTGFVLGRRVGALLDLATSHHHGDTVHAP